MNKSITFSFPLERPHCGVPMANGNFGALVWGKDTLNLTVNQNDLWDHRGGELIDERDTYSRLVEYAEAHRFDHSLNETLHRTQTFAGRPRRLPVGRFDFHFADGVRPVTAELTYATGMLRVTLSSGTSVSLVVALKQNIMYVEDPSHAITRVSLHPASDFPKARDFNGERCVAPYELLEDGWRIVLPEDPGMIFRAVRTDYGFKVFTDNDGDDTSRAEQIAFTADWWGKFCAKTARVTTPDGGTGSTTSISTSSARQLVRSARRAVFRVHGTRSIRKPSGPATSISTSMFR